MSLVNLLKAFAQAINIVIMRLSIEKNQVTVSSFNCIGKKSTILAYLYITELLLMKSARKKSKKVDTEINLRL